MPLFGPNVEKLKTRGDVAGLAQALRHKDKEVRGSAASALAELGEPGVDALVAEIRELSAKGGGWAEPSQAALAALTTIHDPPSIERVWAFVANPDEPIIAREELMEVIFAIDPPRVPERLRKLSEDRVGQMRRSAVRAVEQMDLDAISGGEADTLGRFSETLLGLLGRGEFDLSLREQVADALQAIGTPEVKAAAEERLRPGREAANQERQQEQEWATTLANVGIRPRVYGPSGKCDICSTYVDSPGIGESYEVRSAKFHELARSGYNPFATGRASVPQPYRFVSLTIEQAYADWLRVIARDTTDWVLCRRCADDLAAFALQGPDALKKDH